MALISAQLDNFQYEQLTNYIPKSDLSMKVGAKIEIRSIQQNDELEMIKFHEGLSERSIYMRYFESVSLAARTSHRRLLRICFADPLVETVLVALSADQTPGGRKIVGVGRLNKLPNSNNGEIALLVLDKFQGRGIGTHLLAQLIHAGRAQKITQIKAEMLRDNTTIQGVLKKIGFHLTLLDARSVRAVLSL